MADISKITLPSNTTYNIKDATARTEVAGKQNVITADGILQGDGEGNITAADTASTSTLSNPSSNGTYILQNTVSGGTSTLSWASDSASGGTVTSVGVSNGTNGGLTVSGSPITDSGTITIGHSNVLTNAQTTEAVYPIKIDKNGHISSYGSAVTIPDVSGKIDTAGTGLSKSGTTLNHSNSVTAQTTQGIYPIKIDAQGHISAYGAAVTIPDVSGKIDTAGTGLSKSGTTLNHSNAITAQTTSAVYPIKIDAQGHITEYGSAINYITPPSTVSAGDVLTYDTTNGWVAAEPASGLPAQSSSTNGKVLQSTYNSSTSTASASWESLESVSILTVDSAPVDSSTNLVTSGGVYSAIPSTAANATTGISISDHSTTTIYGVQSSTTTASKASGGNGTAPTLGTAISIPNVTSAGSASNWVFEDVTVPKAATSATTVPIKDASATSIPNVTAVGSGSFSATVTNHVLSFSHAHTAPTLGTAISVIGVQSSTTSVTGVSGSVTGSHVKSGGNGTAPTLGTAISVPNVTSVGSASTWSFSDVTVPIKASSSTTVVTSKTHSVTDSGHTHALS